VIVTDQLHVAASLRRHRRRFVTTVDKAFETVVAACADRGEGEYLWITPEVRAAYLRLHELGWAHSVEAWTIPTHHQPAILAGGLYGVAIGGLFSGESMFHRAPDASKVALAALADLLRADEHDGAGRLIDVQWITPHMASLGALELSREQYSLQLRHALALPLPKAFTDSRKAQG
jgi:leucyl/phenylalanyl-tRNA--protein transferase